MATCNITIYFTSSNSSSSTAVIDTVQQDKDHDKFDQELHPPSSMQLRTYLSDVPAKEKTEVYRRVAPVVTRCQEMSIVASVRYVRKEANH